ncbi:MAG TPA: hypothetical protein VF024_11805 [Solirubrobacteraceae bacterium]
MHDRLGLNLHRDAWPTARVLATHEAAGVRWLQVHTPPASMLADRACCRRHARALRAVLETSSLRLVLHAPDDLSVGTIAPSPDCSTTPRRRAPSSSPTTA